MARTLVWDLPVRLFHWLLASGVIAAAALALALGEHHALFPYHAIIGLVLALLVILRILWGVVGTPYARFGSFLFSPWAVLGYLKGLLAGGGRRHTGHNPASAYAILAMLALVIGLAATGVMMARGNDGAEDVHELMAYALLAVAGAHILGVAVHTLRHKEPIALSMIHGRKNADPSLGIPSARPLAALALLAISGAWAYGLLHAYDPAARATRLPLLGTQLQIGEGEEKPESRTDRHGGEEDDFDDD